MIKQEVVEQIRVLHGSGKSLVKIAKELGISYGAVKRALPDFKPRKYTKLGSNIKLVQ